ncbi:peptidoglycan DD-metalloendopeptidase family protein [Spongiimicrobium salis]|uniref:peptidoglycan DD-metalloendopeptidase family protein n=1 Tax=Spongiimicrobium salis TaxID=1667022 RepID=UPI00374D871E
MKPLHEIILRGNDPTGHGYYGAKRGNRKHKGLDLCAEPGNIVLSPINGIVTKIGTVYKHTSKFKYIQVTGDVYKVRLMYAKLKTPGIKLNSRVFEGMEIGIVQDIAGFWGSKMKNHLHMEVYKHGLLTDPEPLLTE